jgi:uncharacterized membrane protein
MSATPGYGRPGYGEPGYGGPAWDTGSLRASDADREHAVEVLKAGFAEGRIPKDEYDARLHHAYSVPTRADLERVTAQLPGGGPSLYASTAARRTNPLAIASLACGVAQPFTGGLSTIPAIVLGHVARSQIRRTGEDGAGLALAGLLLGWAAVALVVIVITLVAFLTITYTHAAVSN